MTPTQYAAHLRARMASSPAGSTGIPLSFADIAAICTMLEKHGSAAVALATIRREIRQKAEAASTLYGTSRSTSPNPEHLRISASVWNAARELAEKAGRTG